MKNYTKENYKKNGYIISENLISETEIKLLRNQLDKEFSEYDRSKGFTLEIDEIKNKELAGSLIKIINSEKIQKICKELEDLCKKPVSLLPAFHVHKNYHVNLKEVHGWHRDCGGELSFDYCKQKLYQKNYLFSKVGIYLQSNTDFGGGIDIINKTHKNFTPLKTIIRKILNIPFRIITFIHKYFVNLYYIIPENFFMFLMNAKKIYANKGSAIFFDSRLIHRGSPISKKKFKDVKFYTGEYKAKLPKEFDKYVIYLHFGNTEAVDSYMYYKFKTKGDKELKLWVEQINLISKYDTNLSKKMYSIISPIIAKYKNHIIKK